MNAIYQHDPKAVPPLAIDYRMTENTGHMDVGEGVLWRSKVERTPFMIYAAVPLLTTPQPGLVTDIPVSERTSREVLTYAADSYFDPARSRSTARSSLS